MKFYTVDDDYINYLKTIDTKVPNNYNGKRPYVGVLLVINGHDYFAPLTSYKPQQDSIKNNITIYKLHEKGNEDNKLGMIHLNNMIPIINTHLKPVIFTEQSHFYKKILMKQLDFIKSNQNEIVDKANKLYKTVTMNKDPHFCKLSCDFTLLEKHYKNFK